MLIMHTMLDKVSHYLVRTESDSRPVVVMMCGIAGSGKSTLSKAIVSAYPNFTRLSVDGLVAAAHGLYGSDYPDSKYAEYLDEASGKCAAQLTSLLAARNDVVLDRSFWCREDRHEYKQLIESHGGRWVLVYLRAPSKEFLRRRITQRRERAINADSAYEITDEVLDMYWSGFEEPHDEGEVIIDVK